METKEKVVDITKEEVTKVTDVTKEKKEGMTSKEKFIAISFWALIFIFCKPARELVVTVITALFTFCKIYLAVVVGLFVGIPTFYLVACAIGAICQVIFKAIKEVHRAIKKKSLKGDTL